MEIGPKWTSGHRFGHLLVQNGSQEVQECHGTTQDAQNPHNKLRIKDFGVSGVDGGSAGVDGSDFPFKGAVCFPIFPVWGHPLCLS